MPDAIRNQTLALAGALQGLANVIAIANHGHSRKDEVGPCLDALLRVYEGDVEALYGGAARLQSGLGLLSEQLTRPGDASLTRYLVAVIYLERRLRKQPAMLGRLGSGLEVARRQVEYFGPLHGNVISNLGGLYSETISTLKPRIMVQGDRQYLEQPANKDLIRALLLASIRAISLWREAGGSRWRLLVGRRQLLAHAENLLARARSEAE